MIRRGNNWTDASDLEPTAVLTVRLATRGDRSALWRLAGRDSAAVPEGKLLVAIEDGDLRAALSLCSGETIADPFVRTAHLVAALRACANLAEARYRRSPSTAVLPLPGRFAPPTLLEQARNAEIPHRRRRTTWTST